MDLQYGLLTTFAAIFSLAFYPLCSSPFCQVVPSFPVLSIFPPLIFNLKVLSGQVNLCIMPMWYSNTSNYSVCILEVE